jgi:exodeoxyribonuclease VII small subunit
LPRLLLLNFETLAKKPANPTATPEPEAKESTRNFEESVRRLGEIVERLEAGDLPLEESIALFEQGVLLSREAQARLDAAEKRVEQLLGYDENGRPLVAPVEPE